MNDETAMRVIEDYFARKASQAEYKAALNYLATAPATRSRLAKLYRTLVEPGGISCETSQEEMLRYSDPVARREMSATDREQFLLHVSQCVNCAEEYLELTSFEQGLEQAKNELEMPRFKVPHAVPTSSKSGNWPPLLKAKIERVVETSRNWRLNLRFEALARQGATNLIREVPTPYAATSPELVLFIQPPTADLPVGIKVTAVRASEQAETCEVQVILQDLEAGASKHNCLVMLSCNNLREEKLTDEKGRATFEAIPVASLPDLYLEITTSL